MPDGRPDIRGIGRQRVDALVGEGLLEGIPRALAQGIRGILHEDGHEMLPGWGERIVVRGRNGDFEEWLRRGMPLGGVGPGALEIRQRRADVHRRVVWRCEAACGIGGELGQGIEGQVDLQGAALHA